MLRSLISFTNSKRNRQEHKDYLITLIYLLIFRLTLNLQQNLYFKETMKYAKENN